MAKSKLSLPVNIYSGSLDKLGSSLTNPTTISLRKGTTTRKFLMVFRGRNYPDAEAAYHSLKTGVTDKDDKLMAEIIAEKFLQFPDLLLDTKDRGGIRWLRLCKHYTGREQHHSNPGRVMEKIQDLFATLSLDIEGRQDAMTKRSKNHKNEPEPVEECGKETPRRIAHSVECHCTLPEGHQTPHRCRACGAKWK